MRSLPGVTYRKRRLAIGVALTVLGVLFTFTSMAALFYGVEAADQVSSG